VAGLPRRGHEVLPSVELDAKKCDSGGSCLKNCPRGCFEKVDGKVQVVNEEECILCGKCVEPSVSNAASTNRVSSPLTLERAQLEHTLDALAAEDALLLVHDLDLAVHLSRSSPAGQFLRQLPPESHFFAVELD